MPDLLSAYADAQSALARMEERRRLSPVRRPWKIRCFIAERQALAWIDATAVDTNAFKVDGRGSIGGASFDLTHWRQAVGAPINLDTLLADPDGLLNWLGVNDTAYVATLSTTSGLTLVDIRQRVDAWRKEVADLAPSPPLLHGGRIALAWRRRSPIGRGDAVASFLIGDRYGPGRWDASFGGLIALGLQNAGAAWKIADPVQQDRMWLEAILEGARHHLGQEVKLRAFAARAAAHIIKRRRPGRLKEVIMMAMSRPYVTSRLVADQLGLTSAGAIKLLSIATDVGLLLERSGQNSYRRYSIPFGALPAPTPSSVISDALTESNFWLDN